MEKLNRDIRLYYFLNQYDMQMHGGGVREHEIIYNGHKIYYNISPNIHGDINTIFISGGRDTGRRPCFVLSIKGSLANLTSLERGADCFVDRFDSSKDLVKLAFRMAKERGCTEFELTDTSKKICPTSSFRLSEVYFLTTGKTWYESIIPIKIKSMKEATLNEYRKIVKTQTWHDISTHLLSKGVDLNFIPLKGIDIKKAGSAMKVLSRIKSMKNDISCKFFNENAGGILAFSKIESLHDSTWYYNGVVCT